MGKTQEQERKTGQCLCGAVRFEAVGPFRDVWACHCRQCARWSGHYVAATAVLREKLSISDTKNLRWFRSSDAAERGFCVKCGSSLFWRAFDAKSVSIMAGVIDPPLGLRISDHIFTGDKSDYYEICDGAAQHGGGRSR